MTKRRINLDKAAKLLSIPLWVGSADLAEARAEI